VSSIENNSFRNTSSNTTEQIAFIYEDTNIVNLFVISCKQFSTVNI